jgi:hypothetical protein
VTLSASDYTKMTSAQRVAFLRSLSRTTVQEADAPRCQCHTFSLWRSGGAWRCLTCDPPEPAGSVTEAVRATIPGRPVWDRTQRHGWHRMGSDSDEGPVPSVRRSQRDWFLLRTCDE